MKKLCFLLAFATTLFGRVFHAPDPEITPEKEMEVLLACSKTKTLPLSAALKELCAGITDAHFGDDFYDRLKALEKAKYNGEYIEQWPNGQKRMVANYIDGVVNGHVHGWYPDGGEAFKAYYDHGLKIGIHLAFFYTDHRVTSDDPIARFFIYNFKGQLDGEQLSKHYDMHLKAMAKFRKGKLVGVSETWDHHHEKTRRNYHGMTAFFKKLGVEPRS